MGDGNFKADHQQMRKPENDVVLSDGHGFFVREEPYQHHLRNAVEIKQVRCMAIYSSHY